MADISPGVELARRQDLAYAQRLERRVDGRDTADTSSAERIDAARATQQAQEAHAARATDDARKLDAEQRLRDKQLNQDLQRAEQQRQDVADRALQSRTAPPRGTIIDLFA